MEMQRKMMAREEDRLSDLPESILIHILSMLPQPKQVVRTSTLSKRYRFLWKSVPLSLYFPSLHGSVNKKKILAYAASINRELHYWRSCEKIKSFSIFPFTYKEYITEHVDFWIYFATTIANVEEFTLQFDCFSFSGYAYKLPEFAYRNNTSLRNLVLGNCELNPTGSVNWTSLVSLYVFGVTLREGVMETVLLGCPNLECLELNNVGGFRRLEISSVKLRELIITSYETEVAGEIYCLKIFAPYIQYLELLRLRCDETHIQLRNVASLVTAVLSFDVEFSEVEDKKDKLIKECRYFQELLHSTTHVKDLVLDPWCIECLSIRELKGWLFPSSSWKFLKLNTALVALDFPGICRFLQSSPDLEKLVIDWNNHTPRDLLSRYTNEDEQSKRFKTLNFNCSLLHLKTIKVINFDGPLSGNKSVVPLVKYLLKNATVLEKFIISAKFEGCDVSQDYVKMAQEFQSFPRSSPHASVVFSY